MSPAPIQLTTSQGTAVRATVAIDTRQRRLVARSNSPSLARRHLFAGELRADPLIGTAVSVDRPRRLRCPLARRVPRHSASRLPVRVTRPGLDTPFDLRGPKNTKARISVQWLRLRGKAGSAHAGLAHEVLPGAIAHHRAGEPPSSGGGAATAPQAPRQSPPKPATRRPGTRESRRVANLRLHPYFRELACRGAAQDLGLAGCRHVPKAEPVGG